MAKKSLPRHRKRSTQIKPAAARVLTPDQDAALNVSISSIRRIGAQLQSLTEEHRWVLFAIAFILDPTDIWDDLQRMLRGQIIQLGPRRCAASDGLAQIRQRRLGDPLDPVARPHTRLMCPLEEDQEAGRVVACAAMLARAGKENGYGVKGHPQEGPLVYFAEHDLTPCQLLIDWTGLWTILLGEGRGSADAPDRRDLLERRQRLLEAGAVEWADPSYRSSEALRAQLVFLIDSGRLTTAEISSFLWRGVYTTDRGWLSCRDDRRRTQLPTGERRNLRDERNGSCLVCPLQHRALLGDRTVPCAQVLEHRQREALVDAAKDAPRPAEEPAAPLRRSWTTADERPGKEGDIVRRLRILPCHIVGQLLARELRPMLERLISAGDPGRARPKASAGAPYAGAET